MIAKSAVDACDRVVGVEEKLFEIANRRGINCFRGSTKDKLDRW